MCSGVSNFGAWGLRVGELLGASVDAVDVVGFGPTGSGVLTGGKVVAATVPGAGVSRISGVGAGSEQAAKAIRMTTMGNRMNFCKWCLLRRGSGQLRLYPLSPSFI